MNQDIAGDVVTDALVTDDVTRRVMDTFGPEVRRWISEKSRRERGYYKSRPTSKAERARVEVAPVPAMVDAARVLGHAPRPRKRRR